MTVKRAFLVCGLAAAALVGCHGATINEALPDGGGGAGATGAGGGAGMGSGAGTSGGAGTGGATSTGGAGSGGVTGGAGSDGATAGAGGGGASGSAGRGGAGGGAGTGGATGGRGGAAGGAGTGGATGGRGGVWAGGGAGGRGGAGGAGCAAQMQPVWFHSAAGAPVSTDGTTSRYYWVEYGTPYITVHYSPGAVPGDNKHPLQIDASIANTYNIAAGDQRVAATWNLQGKVAAYGPDSTSAQIGSTLTLTNPSAVAVTGTAVYYAHDPMGGSPTPGIYTWDPPAAPLLFESFAALGGDRTLGLLLRVTPYTLLLCDRTDVRMVDIGTKGAAQLLFNNPGNKTVLDVRPARPRDSQGGVIVSLQDNAFLSSGRDYYVNIYRAGDAPTDLAAATSALADASACGAGARYQGAGVLFFDRYVYEGQSGLFAVDVSLTGTVSNLARLTDFNLSGPEVTGGGDLFAGRLDSADSGNWTYYRVGTL